MKKKKKNEKKKRKERKSQVKNSEGRLDYKKEVPRLKTRKSDLG